MLTNQQLLNLRLAADGAVACEVSTGIPAEYLLSQWALESGWGAHSPGNNCFGIKDYPGSFGKQLLTTPEWMTYAQCSYWLTQVPGREATPADNQPAHEGAIKWNCKDWFATFPTLKDCFIKRASRFTGPIAERFKQSRSLHELVEDSAHIYSTDPNYVPTIMRIASMNEVVSAIALARSTLS